MFRRGKLIIIIIFIFDKPWDVGVCDTPELWCGAAGLCVRVHACAGAAESLHTYIHTHVRRPPPPPPRIFNLTVTRRPLLDQHILADREGAGGGRRRQHDW